jgi:hypothetical protein
MSVSAQVRLTRTLFAVLALSSAAVGGWALAAPEQFHRDFPGVGAHHWLPPLGPYNEHMVRDFGALNLGLAAAAVVAAVALTRSAAACATAALETYSVPHLVFHAVHTDPYPVADNVANLVALSLAVLVPAIACWLVWRLTRRGGSG